MLLEDLYTPIEKDIQFKFRMIPNYRDRDKNLLGSGFYSKVYTDKDEHMVRKISSSFNIDPYWAYIDRIIKTKISEQNPYFPRIYSIKKYKDVRGNMLYKGIMEKLIPGNQCNEDELEALLNSIINPEYKKFLNNNDTYDEHIAKIISRVFHGNRSASIDENLNNAGKWFRNEIDNMEDICGKMISIDLHEYNVMYRRTKYGIQAVVTDPVS